jgi:SSS family solute:Na+ symporter
MKMFPEWFAGFCLAAVAIGALVPASIMAIAASNLFTRNLYGEFAHKKMTPRQESNMAKIVSLGIKFIALVFVLQASTTYAIQMQLLGGIWIAQLFPSVVCGAFTRWFRPWPLLLGWGVGMGAGTAMAVSLGLKSSVYSIHFLGQVYPMYAAVPALLLNLLVSACFTLIFSLANVGRGTDATAAENYTH